MRVNKYISEAGICSRRAAEAMIAAGEVYVNAEPARLGQKVVAGVDKITVRGKPVRPHAQHWFQLADVIGKVMGNAVF